MDDSSKALLDLLNNLGAPRTGDPVPEPLTSSGPSRQSGPEVVSTVSPPIQPVPPHPQPLQPHGPSRPVPNRDATVDLSAILGMPPPQEGSIMPPKSSGTAVGESQEVPVAIGQPSTGDASHASPGEVVKTTAPKKPSQYFNNQFWTPPPSRASVKKRPKSSSVTPVGHAAVSPAKGKAHPADRKGPGSPKEPAVGKTSTLPMPKIPSPTKKKRRAATTAMDPVSAVYDPRDTGLLPLEVLPITLYSFTRKRYRGHLIAVNADYICYVVRDGMIRVINRTSSLRELLRGHTADVVDLQFFSGPVNRLVSVANDGRIFVWEISESPGESTTKICYEVLVQMDPCETVALSHVCWHPTDPNLFATAEIRGLPEKRQSVVRLWNIEELAEYAQKHPLSESAAGTHKSAALAAGVPDQLVPVREARTVQGGDVGAWEKVDGCIVTDPLSHVTSLGFDKQGQVLAIASIGNVNVWSFAKPQSTDGRFSLTPLSRISPKAEAAEEIVECVHVVRGGKVLIIGMRGNSVFQFWTKVPAAGFIPPSEARPADSSSSSGEKALASSDHWICTQTFRFATASLDPGAWEKEYANNAEVDGSERFMVVTNSFEGTVHVCALSHEERNVYWDPGNDATQRRTVKIETVVLQSITAFAVAHPILSFALVAAECRADGESAVAFEDLDVFSVQSKAIQNYRISTQKCKLLVAAEGGTKTAVEAPVKEAAEAVKPASVESKKLDSPQPAQRKEAAEPSAPVRVVQPVDAVPATKSAAVPSPAVPSPVLPKETKPAVAQEKSAAKSNLPLNLPLSGPVPKMKSGPVPKVLSRTGVHFGQGTGSAEGVIDPLPSTLIKPPATPATTPQPLATTMSGGPKPADTKPTDSAALPTQAPMSLPVAGLDSLQFVHQRDLRRLESTILSKMDRMFQQHNDRQFSRLDKDRADRDKKEHERTERLVQALLQAVHGAVSQQLKEVVKTEIEGQILPALRAAVSSSLNDVSAAERKATQEAFSNSIYPIVRNAAREELNHMFVEGRLNLVSGAMDKSVPLLADRVSERITSIVQDSFRSSFSDLVVPSFEKSVQAMFTQVSTAFDAGMDQRLTKPFTKVIQRIEAVSARAEAQTPAGPDGALTSAVESLSTLDDKLRGVVQQLAALEKLLPNQQKAAMNKATKGLQESIDSTLRKHSESLEQELNEATAKFDQVSKQLQNIQENMARQMEEADTTKAVVEPTGRDSDLISQTSSSGPPAPEARINEVPELMPVTQALQRGEYDSAFNLALRLGRTDVDRWLISQFPSPAHRDALFKGRTLSQPVLLSLVQHLSLDLSDNLETKIAWLRGATQMLDRDDPTIAVYVDTVLASVTQAVAQACQERAQGPAQGPTVPQQLNGAGLLAALGGPAIPSQPAMPHSVSQNMLHNILGVLNQQQ